MTEYKIVVRELASKDAIYRETVRVCNQHEVERRAGDIWNNPYAGMPDHYRLYVYAPGDTRPIMTIG